MLGNLFRQRSHYVYDYKPRYYDPKKEKYKNLGKSHESKTEISFAPTNLKSQWMRNKKQVADKNANKRLAIIIAILVGIVAYVFKIHTLF